MVNGPERATKPKEKMLQKPRGTVLKKVSVENADNPIIKIFHMEKLQTLIINLDGTTIEYVYLTSQI